MRRKASFFTALVVGGLIAISIACSNQGEGERCEEANDNQDCKDGLVCTAPSRLNGSDSARCCPSLPEQATHPVCQIPVSIAQDAATPPDTGPPPVGDAEADADADAGDTDASDASDASDTSDAPEDG